MIVARAILRLLIAMWTTMWSFSYAQAPTLALIPAQQTPNSTVTATITISVPLVPIWFMLWSFNGIPLGSVHVDFINVRRVKLPSVYQDRISIRASPQQLLPTNRNLVTSLTVTGLLESEEGSLIAASDPIISNFNETAALDFIDDCFTSLPNSVVVQAESSRVGARGEFFCLNGGILFYANGTRLSSNKTTCGTTSQWSGQNELQCWTAPTGVSISLFYDQALRKVFVLCPTGDRGFPPGNTSFIYVGDDVHEVGMFQIPPFALTAIEPRHNGKYLFCQPATPFTRIFKESGRSRKIPLISTVAPFQNSTSTCVWYVNNSGVCDVTFFSKPEAKFSDLIQNGTKVLNDGSNIITIDGMTHRYRFHRNEVTEADEGEYRLIVKYDLLPGLMYALFFRIILRPLPPPAVFCTWFIGNTDEHCDVTIPFEAGTKLISVKRNGIPVDGNITSLLAPANGTTIVRLGRNQVAESDQGTYIITYSRPSQASYDVVVVTTFVLEYPFNPGLVIGVTILAFLVAITLIVLVVHVFQARSVKRKEAEIQMIEVTARNARTPSRATTQPTQYRTT